MVTAGKREGRKTAEKEAGEGRDKALKKFQHFCVPWWVCNRI